MSCQRCKHKATVQITEVLDDGLFEELRLCDACAGKYLNATSGKKGQEPAAVAADVGGKVCDACGMKFVEFRNTGRLGCPHDYDSFKEELVPLLQNIHGAVKHSGKVPRRVPKSRTEQVDLSQLRRRLQKAVTEEDYERAAALRDQIRQMELG